MVRFEKTDMEPSVIEELFSLASLNRVNIQYSDGEVVTMAQHSDAEDGSHEFRLLPVTEKTRMLGALAVQNYNQYFESNRASGFTVDEDFIAIATRKAQHDY